MSGASDDRIIELALRRNLATEVQVATARQTAADLARRGTPRPLGEILVRLRVLTPEVYFQLGQALQVSQVTTRAEGQKRGDTARHTEATGAPTRVGEYEVLGLLGQGGMGAVYKVRHVRLGRLAAMKVINKVVDTTALARFRAEAQAVGRLRHPNIVTVFDAGTWNKTDYLVMELIEGETLAERIERGVFREEVALRIARDLARALEHAHGEGIVHRDLKPDNVVFDKGDVPKILDFGLARVVETEEPQEASKGKKPATLTMAGQLLGTPQYMSPEQASSKPLDGRTDLFSLGVVFYEMLCGMRPFEGDSLPSLLYEVMTKDPLPFRAQGVRVSRETEAICFRALEKKPERRYADAPSFADDLERRLRGEPTVARPLGLPRRILRRAKRSPLATTLLLFIVLLLGTLAGVAGHMLTRPAHLRVMPRPEQGPPAQVTVYGVLPDGSQGDQVAAEELAAGEERVFELPAGGYRVVVTRAGYVSTEEEVVLTRGHERALVVESRREQGAVDLEVRPDGSIIEIAPGSPIARRVASFYRDPFPTGRHNVRVSHPGYYTRDLVLIASLEQPFRKRIDLPRMVLWEARQSGYPARLRVAPGRWPWEPSRIYSQAAWCALDSYLGDTGQRQAQVRLTSNVNTGPLALVDPEGDGVYQVYTVVPERGRMVLDAGLQMVAGRGRRFAAGVTTPNVMSMGPYAVLSRPNGPAVAHTLGGKIVVEDARSGQLLWERPAPRGAFLSAADMQGNDGRSELVAVVGRQLSILDADSGRALKELTLPDVLLFAPALGDLTGDGVPEAVVVTRGRKAVMVTFPSGRVVWSAPITGAPLAPALMEVEGTGRLDVVVAGREGKQGVFQVLVGRSGKGLRRVELTGAPIAPVAIDWDGDGRDDLALACGTDLVVLSLSKGELLRRTWPNDALASLMGGDVDGDGWGDLVVRNRSGKIERITAAQTVWSQTVDAGLRGGPCLRKDVIYVASEQTTGAYALADGRELWKLKAGGVLYLTAGDVDGDGDIEVVLPAEKIKLLDHTGKLVWESARFPSKSNVARPCLVDGNGDGTQDILVGAILAGDAQVDKEPKGLHLFDGRTGKRLWFYPTGTPNGIWGGPAAVGDVGGDGRIEAVSGCQAGFIHVVDVRNGERVWRAQAFDRRRLQQVRGTPLLHDIDGDEKLDVVTAGADGGLYGFEGRSGRRLLRAPGVVVSGEARPVAAEVHEARGTEVLVVGQSGRQGVLHCLSSDLRRELYRVPLPATSMAAPVCADLDGDGELEILVTCTSGRVTALRGQDGRPLWSALTAPGDMLTGPVALQDVDGDGRPDIVAVTHQGKMVVLRGGRRAWRRGWTQDRGGGDRSGRAQ